MAEKELGITQVESPSELHANISYLPIQPEDWNSVTLADLTEIGFSRNLQKPELAKILSERYPGYDWERVFLMKGRYGQQKKLERAVRLLFRCVKFATEINAHVHQIGPRY